MFDGIAPRYDLLNDILSLGQVRLWRRVVARITGAKPGERVLDLAAGTGTSTLTFTATGADELDQGSLEHFAEEFLFLRGELLALPGKIEHVDGFMAFRIDQRDFDVAS